MKTPARFLLFLCILSRVTVPLSAEDSPGTTRTDLKRSMELAGQNLIRMLHPGRDYLPSFLIAVDPDYRAERQMFFMAHNLGRWIDAMYRLEAATGVAAPAKIQEAMLRNVKSYCDNSDDLFLRPLDAFPYDKGDLFCFHSLREQLAALHGLAKYKDSQWARERARRMIVALDRLLLPEAEWRPRGTVWDIARAKRYKAQGCKEVFWGWSPNLQGSEGRLIEPLLWFYELTGNSLALELADRFARFHLELSTRPDGSFYSDKLAGHNHSYMGTLRGLLYFGRVTGQHAFVEAVARTHEKAIPRIVKKSGFTTHDLHRDHGGDLSSAADVAQMALWLGLHHGHYERLDDVQRLVVSRILPSQITSTPALLPKNAERQPRTMVMPDFRFAHVDYPENLGEIIIGALGGIYGRAHGGKWSVTDVTSSVLSVLVSVYENIAWNDRQAIRVHFHFDYDSDFIRIRGERGNRARVVLEPKVKKNLLVRVPGWVPRDSLTLRVGDESVARTWIGPFLLIGRDRLPARVELRYDLPVTREREKAAGTEFEITWRGDEIVSICPNTDFYPFFPTTDGCE